MVPFTDIYNQQINEKQKTKNEKGLILVSTYTHWPRSARHGVIYRYIQSTNYSQS